MTVICFSSFFLVFIIISGKGPGHWLYSGPGPLEQSPAVQQRLMATKVERDSSPWSHCLRHWGPLTGNTRKLLSDKNSVQSQTWPTFINSVFWKSLPGREMAHTHTHVHHCAIRPPSTPPYQLACAARYKQSDRGRPT